MTTPVIEGARLSNLTPEERLAHEKADQEEAHTALTWMQVLNAAARPFMTVMFATTFSVVCVLAWWRGDLSAEGYMTAVGPIVATLVGFWFGERAASQRDSDV